MKRVHFLTMAGAVALTTIWAACSKEETNTETTTTTSWNSTTSTTTTTTTTGTTSTTTTTTTTDPCNGIADPSFEYGTPSSDWTEASTNFGTPLCSLDTCGGVGAPDGDWWAWFGGTSTYEEGSIAQDVTIPAGATTLTFQYWVSACDLPAGAGGAGGAGGGGGAGGAASAPDYFDVLIDGAQVMLDDMTTADCAAADWAQRTVDISAYADGAVHTLVFHSETFGDNGGNSNFNVDLTSIDICP